MAKRAAGEGSVFKRGKRWVAQVGSCENRETKYFDTQREANDWRHKMIEQRRQGLVFAGSKVPLANFLDEWLIVAKTSIRPNTYYHYTQVVNQHIKPTLGQISLKDLRPDQVQSLYTIKLAKGTSPRTTLMIHSVLHRALHHALRLGLVVRNVSDAVIRPKVPRKEMKTLDDYQVRQLFQVAEGTRIQMLLWMTIVTGMRQGELLGLKWEDLDWETSRIQVKRQVQRRKGEGLVFCEPKSAAGRRVISLGKDTIQKLREHKAEQYSERIMAGNKWQDHDLIFPSSIGTPLSQSNLNRDYKQLLQEANLPDIRFHDLRYTAASLMLKQGISVKVVQERLGHSDAAMTLNVYSHVIPGMQREAAEKMDEITALIDISAMLEKVEDQNGLQ